jgi:lipopolysaccharide transport system ATP-binding protein
MGNLLSKKLHVVRAGGKTEPAAVRDLPLAIEVSSATLQYPVGALIKGSIKTNIFRLLGAKDNAPPPTFIDAISNLDLTIAFGERVAIIGRNGSGKSTLLRALGGIYPLKTGSVRVTGQIGTLLDVQLGFELESTGRENIYYRGMAMGYSPKQLREVEKEIIAFADLGRFIDLPMRTYSTGMYVRLGFAVSTQFQPDILLIDEIFGAGDAAFAARAVNRMNNIVDRAGILVMVSHDMELVSRICNRAIWLSNGTIVEDGPPDQVVTNYLRAASEDFAI